MSVFAKINVKTITARALKSREYVDVFPEYYELANVTENGLWHDNQNVLDHVIAVFAGLEKVLVFDGMASSQKSFIEIYLSEVIGTKTRREILMVATLLHDIAKVDTLVKRPDGIANCPGHELIGAARVKNFSERFDLSKKDEDYVERIVRYHGFISEILGAILVTGATEKYLHLFKETVGDVALELVLLMHADLLGSDLARTDKKAYDDRIQILDWMAELIINLDSF